MRKKKKYPKAPKAKSSLRVWENYKDRVQEVDRYNAAIVSDAKKKENLIKSVAQIKNKRRR